MSEDETDKVKIRATESFENDKQNIPWLNEELASPILQPLGDSDNQLTSEKHKDKKPTKGILSSVSEFSIADAPSKDTKSEKKLSDSSSASLSSLEKCRTQFTYIENDVSVHQRDRDEIALKVSDPQSIDANGEDVQDFNEILDQAHTKTQKYELRMNWHPQATKSKKI